MSGGQLLVNGEFAGMLLSTERAASLRGTAGDEVRVLRSDVLDRIVRDAFVGPPTEGLGNRPPPPLGSASTESDLEMRRGETVVLGDQNTAFGVREVYPGNGITVHVNGNSMDMVAGSRISFPDSRGDCFIMFLRFAENYKLLFAIRCNPK
jgi:hypothetical protein